MSSLSHSRRPRHRGAAALLVGAIAATPIASRAGSNSYFIDLTIGPSGYLTGGAGDNFYVSGNFSNNSTQTNSWNTSGALLGLQGGTSHQLTVAGSAGQFGWGTLQINSGDSVTVNGNSATAAATVNNGSLIHVSGASNLGPVSGTGALSVGNAPGGAAASATVSSFNQSSITINATGTLAVAQGTTPSVNNTNSLTIVPGGRLDLANNSLLIHYAPGADPLPTIKTYLASGYDNGRWDGVGIVSSAAAPAGLTLGYADSADGIMAGLAPNTVFIGYAVPGDSNLNGVVDLSDYTAVVRNFGRTNASWGQGSFSYDGTVGLNDYTLVVRNFGRMLSAAAAAIETTGVPEPNALLVLLAGAGPAMLSRRRSLRPPRRAPS